MGLDRGMVRGIQQGTQAKVEGELARQRIHEGELARQRIHEGELARQRIHEGELARQRIHEGELARQRTKDARSAPASLLEAFAERFNERQLQWGVRIGILGLVAVWLFLMAATWSRADDSSSSPQSSDEYNFKWLDPDKKIYVLQNRRYQKAGHALISVTGGPDFGNAYRTSWSVTPRLSYFFTEQFGFEFFFAKTFNTPNNTYLALQNTNTNVFPVIREISGEYGGIFDWAPWYAKINVFNEILYFDWIFGLGGGAMQSNLISQNTSAGQTNTTTTSASNGAVFATTGQQFFVNDRFIIRWDLTGTYYNAPVFGTTGNNAWFSDYRFELGLGVRL